MSNEFSTTMKWDVPCLVLIRRWISQNSDTIFFDIGANHGQFSLVVSQWLDSINKKVYAFEPHPNNLNVLQENLERNRCSNVEVVDRALAASNGFMTLYGENVTASLQSVDDGRQENVVRVETLDKYCHQVGIIPNIIKIDVEGAELDVLKGGINTLTGNHENIKIIYEMHTFMWEEEDYDIVLIDLIKSYGLNIFTLDGSPVERIKEYGHYVVAEEYD
jgi:FkbM family methyltransferase